MSTPTGPITPTSSYLSYLPPVLWDQEPDAGQLPLGALLVIFEKLLTGVDDGQVVLHEGHPHPPVSTEIAQMAALFDPWHTQAEFLPWLASWVALQFPTLAGTNLWDEYQQRKVISQIAAIYRLRGLKAGTNQYLDLYSVGVLRPRVVIDDGSRVLSIGPDGTSAAPVAGLATQGPVVVARGLIAEGVVAPVAVALAGDGSIFLADRGVAAGAGLALRSRVWWLTEVGQHHRSAPVTSAPPAPANQATGPLAPQPLAATTLPAAETFVALAVRPPLAGDPETLYVLSIDGTLYAVPSPYLGASAALVTQLAVSGTTFDPVAMTADQTGDLLVLERGDGSGTPNPPNIITVQLDPLTVTRTALSTVIEPLSLFVDGDGSLLIGDGGVQDPQTPEDFPGNLVRVERAQAGWSENPTLPAQNPLAAPTGIARTADGTLYVLDAGLKPLQPSSIDPFIGAIAEHATVLQVDLNAQPPTLRPIITPAQLVYPLGLAANGNRLIVADPGHPDQPIDSRINPARFDVVIHFTDSRLPADPDQRSVELSRAVGDISTIIDQQKPAHTLWTLVTRI